MTERICITKRTRSGGIYICECMTTRTVYGIGYRSRYCPECGGRIREVKRDKEQEANA